jgi:hypothetical protein
MRLVPWPVPWAVSWASSTGWICSSYDLHADRLQKGPEDDAASLSSMWWCCQCGNESVKSFNQNDCPYCRHEKCWYWGDPHPTLWAAVGSVIGMVTWANITKDSTKRFKDIDKLSLSWWEKWGCHHCLRVGVAVDASFSSLLLSLLLSFLPGAYFVCCMLSWR